jgi:hypothetical protein
MMHTINDFPENQSKNHTIASCSRLSFEQITRETGGRLGTSDLACIFCGPGCRAPASMEDAGSRTIR